jgi:hypothetical protein
MNAVIGPMLKSSDNAAASKWAMENAPCRFIYGLSEDVVR